jgi:prepilin peptidase CpaA
MSTLALLVHAALVAVYALAVGWAVVTDFQRLIIPNAACAAIAVAFLPAALLAGLGFDAIAWHYGVAAALLLAGAVLFARRLAGGGDVKFLAAVAVWIAPADILSYVALMALIGGALAVIVLIAARLKPRFPALGRIAWLGDGGFHAQEVPYGVAVGLAALAMMPRTPALPPPWAEMLAEALPW